MLLAFGGVGVIVAGLAMSVDAYQTEIDFGEDVGIWGKYLLPIIVANLGVMCIVEGLRMSIPL